MLVLTRNIGEEIVIGKELITIKILQVCGQQVRLGIDAPENLSVHRREIYARIAGEEMEPKVPKIGKVPIKREISE